jgi:gluconokinase
MTPEAIVVMGVSGAGKTEIGSRLAAALGWEFIDADDHHPPENIAKMASGRPLDDDDRRGWLATLRALIAGSLAGGRSVVVACSALSAWARERLTVDPDRIRFVHLTGSPELVASRLAAREGHFMPPGLLASQLDALEPPDGALTLDVAASPEALVGEIRRALEV